MFKIFITSLPLANMLVRGLISVIKMDAEASEMPCLIYVFGSTEVEKNMPIEWELEVLLQTAFGNLPEQTDVKPGTYVLGSLDIVHEIGHWDDGILYQVENAHMIDSAIFVAKTPFLRDGGNELFIPTNPYLYSLASNGEGLSLELVGDFAQLVLDENGFLKPFVKYTLWCGEELKSFIVDEETTIHHELNEDGTDLRRYRSVLSPNGFATRAWLHLSCRHPWDD